VILSGCVEIEEDTFLDPDYDQTAAHVGGWRRMLGAPLLKDGAVPRSAGSLAEVLPPGLLECFSAAASQRHVAWRASSGSAHAFMACLPAVPPDPMSVMGESRIESGSPPAEAVIDDLAPLEAPVDRWSASVAAGSAPVDHDRRWGGGSDALLGTLVHRLIQLLGVSSGADRTTIEEAARRAIRVGDNVAHQDLPAVVALAADLYARARQHPQIAEILRAADVWHEVPFSTTDGARVVRGTIDCVARTGPGQVTILEFKTGRRHPWHQNQVQLYRQAVERLFPDHQVRAELLYIGEGQGR